MKQGIQANFPEPRLKKWGCHFFSLLRYLELKHGYDFIYNDIITATFLQAIEKGYMDGECNVLNAPAFLNMILNKEEYSTYIRDLKSRPDIQGPLIIRLVRGNAGDTHFLCDDNGETFDPMPPDRPAAATWSFDSFRCLA